MIKNFRSLNKHVSSLKWSQKLKLIGVRQDTYFYWVYDNKHDTWDVLWCLDFDDEKSINCAAYTVQDFIDIFPKLFKIARNNKEWKFYCEYADMQLEDEENISDVFARILVTITKNKDQKIKLI